MDDAGDADVVFDATDGRPVDAAGDASTDPGDASIDGDVPDADDLPDAGDAGVEPDAGDASTPDASTPALLASDVDAVDFGTHTVPFTDTVVVEIRNDGGSESGVLDVSVDGDAAFTVTATTCDGVALAPGATCTIDVTLDEDDAAAYAGSLEVTDGSAALAIPLSGLLVADTERALVTLVFERVAGATGRVTSTSPVVNEAFDCTNDCTRTLEVGSEVTLTATGDHGFFLSAWAGGCEGTTRTCTFVVEDEPTTITVRLSPANRVFTTQLRYTMAQIKAASTVPTTDEAVKAKSGADAICRSLGGDTFQAWLGVPDNSPVAQRPVGVSGYVRVDQRPFTNVFAPNMHTYYPAGVDQNGVDVPDLGDAWSGVAQNGTSRLRDTCQGWTSTVNGPADLSSVHTRGANWPSSSNWGCGVERSLHLFCYESQYAVDVTPPPPPQGVRRVFLGGGDFNPLDAPGVAGADAICNQDAVAAGLTGTFRAMLATNGASVASRFVARGVRVFRTDGVELAPNEASFFSPTTGARAPLMTTASGARGPTFGYAWVGSETFTAPGQAGDTCANWTANVGEGVRRSMNELPTSSYVGTSECRFSAYLFCLEE